MNYDEIMEQITLGLTGDPKKDFKYLEEQCEKYKDTEYGTEIVRACGRLISQLLPEEGKEKIIQLMKNHDLGFESTLEEVRFNHFEKKFDKALELLEPLVKKVEESYENGLFKDDKVSEYYCFENPMEHLLYAYFNKPEKEIRYSDIPFAKIYMQYGSLLIDLDRWEDAQKALEKAREWNPASAYIIFELCETYKHLGQLDLYFETIKDSFKYCFEPGTVARAYRALGWYFTEKEMYEEAAAVYILSLQYEHSDFVTSEMYYITQKSGKDVPKPGIEDIKRIGEKYGFTVGAHDDVLGLAYSYGQHAVEQKDNETAKYFLSILYNLTDDEKVKAIIDKL